MKPPVLILLAIAASLCQTRPQDRLDLLIREDFFAGLGGDSARLDRAMKECEEILAKDPKNPSALVWHGGGLYFRAGRAFREGDTAKGLELFHRGQGEMNEAVSLAPESIQTRIPRGAILLASARFQDDSIAKPLLETATSDYEKALELEKGYFDQASTHSKGELIGGLADAYRRLGNMAKARENLDRLVKELPGTLYEKQASRWLRDLTAISKQEGFCLGCHVGSARDAKPK
jgi:tetratricopeptide (TPR) repeat protein